jgi:UDP-N-acetylmuramate--alanine ligase
MHIYFSGIGGAGIGPLAEVAFQAGYQVSGSDKRSSSYITALKKSGIENIFIDQSYAQIAKIHASQPIDWFVYSSALTIEQPNAPELKFVNEHGIKASKRDELINEITRAHHLSLVAVAGTHGKTTTTAMIVWLCLQLKLPISYLLPAKTSFGPLGHFQPGAKYFVIEADEFDRNFLQFNPEISVISGVSWDHHEVFPTRENYQQAFLDFINHSQTTYLWDNDAAYLGLTRADKSLAIEDSANPGIEDIKLKGLYNRRDGWLALQAVQKMNITMRHGAKPTLGARLNEFPGLSRRMELLIPNLYSDYAHTPEKIRGVMSVAREMTAVTGQKIVVVYEPLTDRRQHYMLNDYRDCFDGATRVYWLPSYLAREDPGQTIIEPRELIARLDDPGIAQPAEHDDQLKQIIDRHLAEGDLVIGIAGGGGDSLDDWLRDKYLG